MGFGAFFCLALAADGGVRGEVSVGPRPFPGGPVEFAAADAGALLLGPDGNVRPQPAGVPGRSVAILPPLPAGAKAGLRPGGDARLGVSALAKATAEGVELSLLSGGKAAPVTTYRTAGYRKPVLWPLLAPGGVPLTAMSPADHVHQKSVWFTHGKVNGVDFWSESPKSGTQVPDGPPDLASGPAFARVRQRLTWRGPDGKAVAKDVRTVTLYALDDPRVIDYAVELSGADGPLTLGDDKEGTFGVRVARELAVDSKQGGKLSNAQGLANAAVWGKRSPWCDYAGRVGGQEVGLAILEHPAAPWHPTTWHARTYGLFAANPFGLKAFTGDKRQDGSRTVPAGQALTFRYRLVLHRGGAAQPNLADWHAAYADPPKVTF